MANDDTQDPARAARAARLHNQIKEIVKPKNESGKNEPSLPEKQAERGVDYREAIRRRMRELGDKG